MIAYGPVPSRRLGQSLGINNIPPKICTYSCVYCQVGRTINMQLNREKFFSVARIIADVEDQVSRAQEKGERIDYLTFVPDGEPTLDCNIGDEIDRLKALGIKIAVITNGTLLWREDVREDIMKADWVSVKIDAVSKEKWLEINRPHKLLQLEAIQEGIMVFSRSFNGSLATETMLIDGINDNKKELEAIGTFVSLLEPQKSYLSIPTRPPAEKRVKSASEQALAMAYSIFKEKGIDCEYLIGYEGNALAYTGVVEEDILGITAVHPLREDGVNELLRKANAGWAIVTRLINDNKLMKVEYQGKNFYVRRIVNEK